MTLDVAIKHCEEVAESKERQAQKWDALTNKNNDYNFEKKKCIECANEHRQLAEWLKELKELRKHRSKGHWIQIPHTKVVGNLYECSICEFATYKKFDYCTCGADMREPKESEETDDSN